MIFAALLALLYTRDASHELTSFKDCGSTAGTIQNVTVEPCSNPSDCELKKGTSPKIKIAFTPNSLTTQLKAVVHGIVKGIPVPFPLPNPDACKDSGITCPLSAKVPAVYEQAFEIKKSYPSIGLLIRWELRNEQDKDVVCFVSHVHIVE
uniref:MD-2-related lipid-recognition domain-containing protein n=1 Tax=Trichuris muris TaxID=70415 RepID=A0A5S6QZM0_TRIMR